MAERILLVDDDANLLSALQRQLRRRYELTTALGGEAALTEVATAMDARDPYAVVVCDMRMPGMDGIEVLSRIRDISPDTVRLMLTGNADQQTAIDAINKGNIFRFLTKPCPTDELATCLEAALGQYRLVTAERELLEKTLAGSIKVLTDVVSLNDPVAYALGCRLREWVRTLTLEFKLPARWQLEIAAMLVPIAQVCIPPELVAKQRRGEKLSDAEKSVFDRAPESASALIANIPRLQKVAEVIMLHDRGFDGSGFPSNGPKGADLPFDARLLKILKDLALESGSDAPSTATFAKLAQQAGRYDPALFARVRTCLQSIAPQESTQEVEVPVSVLRPGNVVISDILLTNGHLILAANTKLSVAQVERLKTLSHIYSFVEPVRVRV